MEWNKNISVKTPKVPWSNYNCQVLKKWRNNSFGEKWFHRCRDLWWPRSSRNLAWPPGCSASRSGRPWPTSASVCTTSTESYRSARHSPTAPSIDSGTPGTVSQNPWVYQYILNISFIGLIFDPILTKINCRVRTRTHADPISIDFFLLPYLALTLTQDHAPISIDGSFVELR